MTYSYINEDQIDVELKCTICVEPFRNPVNCLSCGSTFCQHCIETWKQKQMTCPSCRQQNFNYLPVLTRVVLNQLNRLLVKCDLCEQIDIQRSNFTDHLTVICPKQVISCADQCSWRGKREEMPGHLILCRQRRMSGLSLTWKWMSLIVLIISIFIFIFSRCF